MIMKVVTIHTKVSIRATCCSPGWTMILYTHRRCLEVAHFGTADVANEYPIIEQRTNPLTRERAARGAEFVATTEDAVEMR